MEVHDDENAPAGINEPAEEERSFVPRPLRPQGAPVEVRTIKRRRVLRRESTEPAEEERSFVPRPLPPEGRRRRGADDQATTGASAGVNGAGIVTTAWLATAVFSALSIVAVVLPDSAARPAAVVDIVLFGVGLVAFLWAYVVAVQRSRTDAVTIGGVYFLMGETAPAHVRTRLRLALGVEIVVAIAAASIRPFTSVAFAVLVPMLGLGLCGLWGARHGTFPPRPA